MGSCRTTDSVVSVTGVTFAAVGGEENSFPFLLYKGPLIRYGDLYIAYES